ncbi:MAG: c-type cytochrome [Burkholderiaceae bacterium]
MKKNLAFAVVALLPFLSLASLDAVAGGDIEAGKAAAQKHGCAACHGANFNSPIDPTYPKLAGQHQDYLAQALVEYRRGGDGPNGRANAIMGAQAKTLTDEDIQNLAAYLHSLPGSLYVRQD